MAYSKLHSTVVNSSLWSQSLAARVLFVSLLAVCDQDGVACGSKSGLTRQANIPPEDAEEAWRVLLSPDAESSDGIRAPENEGRRIEPVAGGFRLLNFAYYRGLRNEDERRRQNKEAQERFRDKHGHGKPAKADVSHGKPAKADVSHGKPAKAQAEAEAEAEAEAKEEGRGAPRQPLASVVNEVFDEWNNQAAKSRLPQCLLVSDKRRRKLEARFRDPFFASSWRAALAKVATSNFCLGKNDRGWVASFDWFIQPDTVAKITEGKYDNRSTSSGKVNPRTQGICRSPATDYAGAAARKKQALDAQYRLESEVAGPANGAQAGPAPT